MCDYQSQPGFTHWGSFAEYVAIDFADTNLVKMLEMIKNGKLQPEKLIEKTITLEEATIALPNMDRFENMGVLVIDSF